jgi:hypothetical protein
MRRVAPSFDPNNPEQVEALQKLFLQKAARGRESAPDFIDFVMREQTTKQRIRCAPHQRVGIDFALAHPRCVLIWPAGAAKTYTTVGLTLWLLGRDVTTRGIIVSKTQELAMKPLSVVRAYLDESPELKLVFPHLRRAKDDSWRQDRIVVERPRGIPDASLAAVGIDGAIQGSRLNWAIVDDILDAENVRTADARKRVIDFVYNSVVSRLDPVGGRLIVNNTAWHPEDLVHFLKDPKGGAYPSLLMKITGDVEVGDDPYRIRAGMEPWDHPLLRPKYETGEDYTCRIFREGVDDRNRDVPLFPERFFYMGWELPDGKKLPPARDMAEAIERAQIDIENKRREYVGRPGEFNRLFMGQAHDDSTAPCKREYIEKCKALAREAGYFEMVSEYRGPNPTFTGVDLAVGQGEENDDVAFFTFEVLPDRRRRILDVESGKWPGPIIVQKIIEKHQKYNSIVRVENNAAQDFIRQDVIWNDATVPVKAHCTGRTKAHPEYGVPAGFAELANGAWMIPNDRDGRCHPALQKWIDGCIYYTPQKHTDDRVMAWWFAREQAKEWGLLSPKPKGDQGQATGSLISGIMSR